MIYAGLLLFFVMEYVRPADSLLPFLAPLRLNTIVPLGIFALTLLSQGKVSNGDVASERATRIFGAWLVWMTVSVVFAGRKDAAMTVLSAAFGYLLIYWVIAKGITDLRRLKGVFAVLAFVHLLLAALTPEMFIDADERHYIASGTFLADGNDYALSVNVALPLCLFLWGDATSKLRKALSGAAVLALILCIVATKSRGGTIGLAAVGLYYWTKSDKKLKTAMFGCAAVLMILVVAPPSYFARMDSVANTQEGSAQGRIQAWNAATTMAITTGGLGVGAGNFSANWGKTAHSIYFLALGELGLIGVGLLITIIASNLMENRRLSIELRKRHPVDGAREIRLLASTSAAMIAFATGGAFLSAIYYPHMYVLGGMLCSARRLARERLETAAGAAPPAAAPAVVSRRWSPPPRKVSSSRIA
jgi:probable O-glycosylation ligase (exosortase A-associated)